MKQINKKQKIAIVIVASILVLAICYYVYAQENKIFIETEEGSEITENQEQNQTEEQDNMEEQSDTEEIVVHISGAVQQEGIVKLKEGSRIIDAIEKAGGTKENAYLEEINLAYPLEDGTKIHIPTKEEINEQKSQENYITKESGVENSNEENTNNEKQNNNLTTNGKNTNKTSKININTATESELDTLPGIGPSIAAKIVSYRKENGKFKNIEQIKEVSGIGESKYNKIKDLITI